jgi:hypothetical protein
MGIAKIMDWNFIRTFLGSEGDSVVASTFLIPLNVLNVEFGR